MLHPLNRYDLLILPCRENSGPDHWQSHWQAALPNTSRVEQDDWVRPTFSAWAPRLDAYLARATRPVILIAHSLGTSLVMRWAGGGYRGNVAGAFLVACSDRGEADIWPDAAARGFAPMVLEPLPFPSMVVASRNDPYVAFERSVAFAAAWGSVLVDMGDCGHMGNSEKLGLWPQGLVLLGSFLAGLERGS
jgi:hypothetical protein